LSFVIIHVFFCCRPGVLSIVSTAMEYFDISDVEGYHLVPDTGKVTLHIIAGVVSRVTLPDADE
jgi:hypothetical protein